MTHASKLAAAKREVVEAGLRLTEWENGRDERLQMLHSCMDDSLEIELDNRIEAVVVAGNALLALRARTCPECKGRGIDMKHEFFVRGEGPTKSCPAGCREGERV